MISLIIEVIAFNMNKKYILVWLREGISEVVNDVDECIKGLKCIEGDRKVWMSEEYIVIEDV